MATGTRRGSLFFMQGKGRKYKQSVSSENISLNCWPFVKVVTLRLGGTLAWTRINDTQGT